MESPRQLVQSARVYVQTTARVGALVAGLVSLDEVGIPIATVAIGRGDESSARVVDILRLISRFHDLIYSHLHEQGGFI